MAVARLYGSRDPGAIEVDQHAHFMGSGTQVSDLGGRIEGAEFGCLREGDDPGLNVVLNAL